MTFKDFKNEYWNYYISLESQFLETQRYVQFDYVINGRVYSVEYLKLFQAVCSEIDAIGKVLAGVLDDSFKPNRHTGLNEWWYYITNTDTAFGRPSFIERKCCLLGEHDIQPWKNLWVKRNNKESGKKFVLDEEHKPKGKTPTWWNDYNSVKHNRTGKYERYSTNFAKANLKNVFYGFAALYSLEVRLMEVSFREGDVKIPLGSESKLFPEKLPFYTETLEIH